MRRADPFWLAAAVLLLPLNIGVEAAIWLPVLRLVVPGARWAEAARAVVGGYPLGFFTPARIGEFAGRAFTISDQRRMEIGISAAAARVPELAVLLAAGAMTFLAAALRDTAAYPGSTVFTVSAVGAAIAVSMLYLIPGSTEKLVRQFTSRRAILEKIRFLERFDARMAAALILLSTLRLLIFCSQFVLLARSFDARHSTLTAYEAVISTFTAKSIIPAVTFLDLGIREGAASFFFHHLGIGASVGFSAALALFVVNVIIPTLVGLLLVSKYRVGRPNQPVTESPSRAEAA